ncbi:hypothetical protein ACIRRH_41245 [Kitasatospora sp. NPDC101235]|uniref:hypothetical protein n=1 Tax=Kitasatospora sp. NPDC101235 TaxID=3364101 RepID=UPI003811CC07
MTTARQRLENLLHDYRTETVGSLLDQLTADAYRTAADVLEVGNPDRSPEFTEGVDWAVETLRSAADKTVGGAR